MLISWQSTLGGGTSKSQSMPEAKQLRRQKLNFVGKPELTRHLTFAALRETYSDDPQVLVDALHYMMQDFVVASEEGIHVSVQGHHVVLRLVPIAVKGDWPWLIECGSLSRHFRRAAKRSSSDCMNVGLCHFCMGGSPGIPDADPYPAAKWISTMGSAASFYPWEVISPVTKLMPGMPSCPAYIYRPDLFHNWHLGMGQCFVASSLVLLQNMCAGSSIPRRFETMTALWRAYCRSRRLGSALLFVAARLSDLSIFSSAALPAGKSSLRF